MGTSIYMCNSCINEAKIGGSVVNNFVDVLKFYPEKVYKVCIWLQHSLREVFSVNSICKIFQVKMIKLTILFIHIHSLFPSQARSQRKEPFFIVSNDIGTNYNYLYILCFFIQTFTGTREFCLRRKRTYFSEAAGHNCFHPWLQHSSTNKWCDNQPGSSLSSLRKHYHVCLHVQMVSVYVLFYWQFGKGHIL